MEFINHENIKELSNPGVISKQLINPENSESERVTITEVHLEVGADASAWHEITMEEYRTIIAEREKESDGI